MSPTQHWLAILAAILFSGDQISRKFGLQQLPPLRFAVFSFTLSSLVTIIYLVIRNQWKTLSCSAHQLRMHLLTAILFFVCNLCLLFGVQLSQAGRASVLIATNPIFVALFSSEKLGVKKLSFLFLSLAGVAIVFFDPLIHGFANYSYSTLSGDLLLLLGALFMAVMILHIRTNANRTSATVTTFYQLFFSVPLFLLASLFLHEPASDSLNVLQLSTQLSILYQAIILTAIGYTLRAYLVAKVGAQKITSYFLLTPIVAVAISHFLLAETISSGFFLGGAVTLLGLFLFQNHAQ